MRCSEVYVFLLQETNKIFSLSDQSTRKKRFFIRKRTLTGFSPGRNKEIFDSAWISIGEYDTRSFPTKNTKRILFSFDHFKTSHEKFLGGLAKIFLYSQMELEIFLNPLGAHAGFVASRFRVTLKVLS